MQEVIKLHLGDCLEVMRGVEDNSVDSIVTDPPYGLSFMGKKWDYDVPSKEVWQEALRVLKPGGHLLSFCGTRTYHRMAVNIEDAGFEIRDMVEWIYGSGFPKSLNIGKAVDKLQGNEREVIAEKNYKPGWHKEHTQNDDSWTGADDEGKNVTKGSSPWEGWGTALKPSHESICLAKKPYVQSHLCEPSVRDTLATICQLPSLATTVKRILASNQKEQGEVASIVQWLAEENTSTQDALFVLMATLQSESEKNISLNIVSSWLNILVDLLKNWSTFTTETKISLIIDLKTLNSLLVQTTQDTTTKAETEQNGVSANVLLVDKVFSVLELKLKTILELSVEESAMSKGGEQGLPPNHEPICLARKPLSEKTVAENVLKWGTGGLNIDKSRVGETTRTNSSKPNTKNDRIGAIKGYTQKMETTKYNYGRFPANLLHDGSDEVVSLFPNNAHRFFKEVAQDSFSMVECSQCGHILTKETAEDTECGERKGAVNNIEDLNTDGYGNNQTEESQTDMKSTIKTTTTQTTPSKTSNVSQKNGTTTIINDCEKTTRLSKELNVDDARTVKSTDNFGASQSVRQGHTKDTARIVVEKDCENGDQETSNNTTNTTGHIASLRYCPKASKAERDRGCEGLPTKTGAELTGRKEGSAGMSGSEEHGNSTNPYANSGSVLPRANHHPTVKPIALMEYLIEMITPDNGTVLDPYMGSGTTGIAAKKLRRNFIGIERESEYMEIAKKRIEGVKLPDPTLI